jgi:hypothetical protein
MRSFSASSAGPLATLVVPEDCVPGGNPVIEVPGEIPMSPPITVAPVFVIALPASTAKVDAVPRLTVAWAAMADWVPTAAKVRKATPVTNRVLKESRSVRGTPRLLGPRRAAFEVFSE